MFKKTLLFTFLAAAIFASPVVNSVATSFIVPVPSCYPCGPAKYTDIALMVATEASEPKESIVPVPSCYPCGAGASAGFRA